MTTPLPCPFCWHVGLDFQEGSTFRWLAYSCGGCDIGNETRVQTFGEHGTTETWRKNAEQDAIKEWNTRAQPAAEPLTDEQIAMAMLAVDDPLQWGHLGEGNSNVPRQFARAIEAAHGIGKETP